METVEQVELAQLKDANRAQVTWLRNSNWVEMLDLLLEIKPGRLYEIGKQQQIWMICVSKFNQTLC